MENSNNVARNCFRILQVQKCWIEAADAITLKLYDMDHYYEENTVMQVSNILNNTRPTQFKLLDVLVGNGYSIR